MQARAQTVRPVVVQPPALARAPAPAAGSQERAGERVPDAVRAAAVSREVWVPELVPRSRLAEAEEIAVKAAETYTPGDPFDADTRLGPLVSETQRQRVRGYIEKGVDEGATLLTGGAEAPEGLDKGYFVRPTVFSGVRNDMTIAQEEIFGPVLSIIPYDDEDDAVRIANDTIYGLAAGVWSGDPERAKAVARRIRSGQVEVNGGAFNPMAPFGGFKQSGHGRELGKFAIEEFLTTKSLQL